VIDQLQALTTDLHYLSCDAGQVGRKVSGDVDEDARGKRNVTH
jgi:hypothetical protein